MKTIIATLGLVVISTGCAGWNDPPQPPRELTAYEKQKQLDGQKCAYEADLARPNDRFGFQSLPLIAQCMKIKGYT